MKFRSDVAELIAEGREFADRGNGMNWQGRVRELAGALETLMKERDDLWSTLNQTNFEAHRKAHALAAVIEQLKRTNAEPVDVVWERWREIFDTAPADVLREHDAALIESLADDLRGSPTSDPGTEWAQRDIAGWLREQAQKRRDGSE